MRVSWWRQNASGVALTFVLFGLLALGGGVVFVGMRPILFVLFWTFLFAAALFRFLVPERRIRANIAERIHTTLLENETTLLEAYDIQNARVYVPKQRADFGDVPARLFVPLNPPLDAEPSDVGGSESSIVVSEGGHRGILILPSSTYLFREFESMLEGELSESPEGLIVQLADGVVEGLELADKVVPSIETVERRATFKIDNGVYGPVDRFDHPVSSFFAVGLAVGLGRPIIMEATNTDDTGYIVTCRWEDGERFEDGNEGRDQRETLA